MRIFVQRTHLCVNSSKMRTVLHGDGNRKSVGYDGSSLIGVATRRTPLVLLRPPSGVQVVITLSLKRRYKLLYVICAPSPSRVMALVAHLRPTRASAIRALIPASTLLRAFLTGVAARLASLSALAPVRVHAPLKIMLWTLSPSALWREVRTQRQLRRSVVERGTSGVHRVR